MLKVKLQTNINNNKTHIQHIEQYLYYLNILYVTDYEVLAEILTQRPIRTQGFKLTTRITEEQMQEMTEMAKHRFDEIMEVLKIMPRSLLLVVRYYNNEQ